MNLFDGATVALWLGLMIVSPCAVLVMAQDNKIIGGKPANAGEFPAFAHPVFDDCGGSCGGTLIHPDVVMSAAHCQGAWNQAGKVGIGGLTLCGTDATEIINVDDEYNHPLYDGDVLNDVALIKLSSPSTVTPSSWNSNPSVPIDNALVEACGFGLTENGFTEILLKVTMRNVNKDTCETLYENNIGPLDGGEVLCADAEDKSVCYGDSGGPLYIGGTNTVAGVTSYTLDACSSLPAGFARVSTYDNWIKKTICAISDIAPTTYSCDFCGDGICDGNEDCQSCTADCGPSCPSPTDGVCEVVESCNTSPVDCGPCGVVSASCPSGISAAGLALNGIGSAITYELQIPVGQSISCSISGGTGDADLSVILGDSFCESKEDGNVGSCKSPGATAGSTTATVEVVAFEPFSGVTLMCTCATFVPACNDGFCTDGAEETCSNCPSDCGTCPPTCEDGINETGLTANQFDILSFFIPVDESANVVCQTSGGSGDVALEVFILDTASSCFSDDDIGGSSSNEYCELGNTAQDDVTGIINLYADTAFSGVRLICTCGQPSASPSKSPSEQPDGFPFNIPILGAILRFIFSIFFPGN